MKFFNRSANHLPTCLKSVWVLLLLALPQVSFAGGTPSGTSITNKATVDYVIGTTAFPPITSNTVVFAVDKKINLLVTETTGTTTLINPGQLNAVTTFTVTNLGNDAQGFSLAAAVATGDPAVGGIAPFTTNDFNAANLRVFVDNPAAGGTAGIYDAAFDTATSIPVLEANPILGKTSVIVFVIGDIPASLTGQQSVVSLTATATALAGDPPLPTPAVALATPNTASGVEVSYADTAGVVDTPRDGKSSAYSAYVAGAVVALRKTIASVITPTGVVIANPLSGDPALHPGSKVSYQIIASFTGSGTIGNLVITDPLPAQTTYVPNSISVDGIAKTDIATDADNVDFTNNIITVTRGSVTTSQATPAADVIIQFQATIN